MSQVEYQEQPQSPEATGGSAATMPEPDFHPFAEEARQMEQASGQGASAPEPQPVPSGEGQQPAPDQPAQQPESDEDYRRKYEELQQQLEAQNRQREQERQTMEQQQQQWLEFQRRQNEQQAAEMRKRVEDHYKTNLKSVYEQAVSADSDDEGMQKLDEFIRQQVAAPIAQSFEQRLHQTQQQHQRELEQFKSEAEREIKKVYKPGFANELIQQHQLPDKARDYLMTVDDPEQMPQRAEELKQILAQLAPGLQQQYLQNRVDQHRSNGTYAVGGGPGASPRPQEVSPMNSDDPQALEMARDILGI